MAAKQELLLTHSHFLPTKPHSTSGFYRHQSSVSPWAQGFGCLAVVTLSSTAPLSSPSSPCSLCDAPHSVRVWAHILQRAQHLADPALQGGEVVDGKKRFSEARGTEPRSSVAFQTHETSSKETSSATRGFENTQETGPTERKAAERPHRNPGGDLDNNWLPYTDVFMNFSPLTPSQHALCNQPEYDNTPSSS